MGTRQLSGQLLTGAGAFGGIVAQITDFRLGAEAGLLSLLACGAVALIGLLLWFVPEKEARQARVAWGSEARRGKAPPKSIEMIPAPEERIFIHSDITPQYLLGLREGMTNIQAKAALSLYIGKWMKVSGPLMEIDDNRPRFDFAFATLCEHGLGWEATLTFTRDIDRLSTFRKGDVVNAIGKIVGASGGQVNLVDCELAKD